MKHLKKFANTFDYNSAKLALELPNISKVVGDVAMHCNIYRPLYFKFNTASTVTIKWAYYSPTSGVNITYINYIEWSNDKGATWNKVTTPQTFTTDSGLEIWVRAKGTGINYTPDSDCLRFTPNADCTIGGNIVSLLYGDQNFSEVPLSSSPTFGSIFYNATHITDAKNLILPYKTVSSYAYYNMFRGCTSLVTAPELPATTINSNCYTEMFKNCTSLITAPALPATTLSFACYGGMFEGCTSLKDAPALLATTLANYCYSNMFHGCTSLVSAPKILPATTLANYCYSNMFHGCTSLVIAPELPAETLTNYCYANMFNGCTKLNYIKALFTSIPNGAPYATGWVTGVASTGTFIRREESLDVITGVDGIPSGWDVTTDAQYKYLTFEIAEAGTIVWTRVGTSVSAKEIQYSTDNGRTWMSVTSSAAGTSLGTFNAGQRILIKGNNSAYGGINYNNYNKFDGTAKIKVYGNIMSLIYGDSFVGKTSLPSDWTFTMMFYENANLLSIKHLVLPATTLRNYCYGQMFMNCTSLTNTPEILPATTLTIDCYSGMFGGCSSLTTTPELPATTLAYHCYGWMFGGCSSLTTAPELPATTLAATCYSWMFADCSSLTTAPELPATTLKTSCYYAMFARCASLTTPPVLPATTLAPYCYQAMFQSAGITVAPELPVTTLAKGCYHSMFAYCASLTTAPELPATTLVQECYQLMFYEANNINYIKCLATDISATDCTRSWVENVSATGTFVKEIDASWTTGTSGIPTGWTTNTVIINPETKYMTFEVVNDGTITWKANSANNTTISYSTDNGSTWTSVTSSTSGVSLGTFNAGQKVLIKGTNTAYGTSSYYNYFGGTAKVNVYGNIMSLIYGDNFINQTTLPASYTFKYLFYGYSNLLSAEYLVLPATTLVNNCYDSMFYNCTSMITAPELPATTLVNNCYDSMFYNCTSMMTAPELPATTLANNCYYSMFRNCTSLTTPPVLPATTLANNCYRYMFYGCTSLMTAPELPATTLANYCYESMFYGCSSLNNITCLATDISATDCTSDWVTNVSATGTFVRDENMSSWTIGTSGIPTGWTVNTAAAYKYMTFNVVTPGTITFTADNDTVNKTISYSTDNGSTWTSVTSSTAGTSLGTFTAGQKVLIKGTNTAYDTSEDGQSNYFGGTAQVNLTGNIMSLIYGDNFKNQITLSGTYVFSKLFYGYSNLLSAENLILPATTLPAACYANMFYGCTNLTAGPELPATTFATNCYYLMYSNTNVLPDCTNIDFTSTTVVQSGVMRGLFAGTKVTDNDLRNILPINITTNRCYLPVTSLKNGCYVNMFEGCTSLTTAPELPATTLKTSCYYRMFRGCTSLVTAPELPATTLVATCYSGMFAGCTSLKYIKCLATDISENNCTSNWVTNVALSGTFVKNASMSSWTTGTSGIPSGWTTLNHVDNPETKYMTFEVVNKGTITWKTSNANNTKPISYSTDNGSTWTSVTSSTSGVSLGTFTAGKKVLIKGTNTAYGASGYYNYFGGTAKVNVYGNIMSLIYGDNFTNQITLPASYTFRYLFYGYSNLLSAEYLVLPATTLTNSCYERMFYNCTSMITVPVLSATTLTNSCYERMFYNCTSMITAPELPATTLAESCYYYMFDGCTSMITAPELPATTLANGCYRYMFNGCTSLMSAPELPATTLADSCYYRMFYNTNVLPDCTNIDFTSTTVVQSGGLRGLFAGTKVTDSDLQNILPINPSTGNYWLPATTLTNSCYEYMFQDCKSMITAPELPATTLAESCYYYMFDGCTSLLTAPELHATTLANNCYRYMFYGCTSLVTAPELPATTLTQYCYYRMFYGCKKLNYIKCLATNISATSCTNNWVTNVASSGTFVKNTSMSSWTTGTSGIPSGWTVQDAA